MDKFIIDDFNQLKDEMEILSQKDNENLIIKVNGKEVNFEDIYDVFLCTLENKKTVCQKITVVIMKILNQLIFHADM